MRTGRSIWATSTLFLVQNNLKKLRRSGTRKPKTPISTLNLTLRRRSSPMLREDKLVGTQEEIMAMELMEELDSSKLNSLEVLAHMKLYLA
jgi:hypothetical protein